MNIESLIERLREKYLLSELDETLLKTEADVVLLRVEFAKVKSKELSIPFYDSLIKYAGLGRLVRDKTKLKYLKNKLNSKKNNTSNSSLENITEYIFLRSYRTEQIISHKYRGNCFWYDIWNNEGVNLHFKNALIPKNPFKGKNLERLKSELKKIAKDIKKNHPEVKYIFGVSWIRGIKTYRDLMPKETKYTEWKKQDVYSMGHFGQFYRADGTLNKERYDKFRKTWKFEIKTYLGECKIEDFFKMYL